jgi:hypothetical protein
VEVREVEGVALREGEPGHQCDAPVPGSDRVKADVGVDVEKFLIRAVTHWVTT